MFVGWLDVYLELIPDDGLLHDGVSSRSLPVSYILEEWEPDRSGVARNSCDLTVNYSPYRGTKIGWRKSLV